MLRAGSVSATNHAGPSPRRRARTSTCSLAPRALHRDRTPRCSCPRPSRFRNTISSCTIETPFNVGACHSQGLALGRFGRGSLSSANTGSMSRMAGDFMRQYWRRWTGKRQLTSALPLVLTQILTQAFRHRHKVRRNHHHRRAVVLGPHLRDHLHSPQLQRHRISGHLLRRL